MLHEYAAGQVTAGGRCQPDAGTAPSLPRRQGSLARRCRCRRRRCRRVVVVVFVVVVVVVVVVLAQSLWTLGGPSS